MPKSKNRKGHAEKLARYKANKKKEQDLFKKKLMDNYIKMQQEALAAKESHTSTQEVSGPDINIDELNDIEPWEPGMPEETINLEPEIEITPEIQVSDDNNNK